MISPKPETLNLEFNVHRIWEHLPLFGCRILRPGSWVSGVFRFADCLSFVGRV